MKLPSKLGALSTFTWTHLTHQNELHGFDSARLRTVVAGLLLDIIPAGDPRRTQGSTSKYKTKAVELGHCVKILFPMLGQDACFYLPNTSQSDHFWFLKEGKRQEHQHVQMRTSKCSSLLQHAETILPPSLEQSVAETARYSDLTPNWVLSPACLLK